MQIPNQQTSRPIRNPSLLKILGSIKLHNVDFE